jgi:hypothetical protein
MELNWERAAIEVCFHVVTFQSCEDLIEFECKSEPDLVGAAAAEVDASQSESKEFCFLL